MYKLLFLTSFFLAPFAASMPTAVTIDSEFGPLTGTFGSTLDKRAAPPVECSFQSLRSNFAWFQMGPNQISSGTACFGWSQGDVCANKGPWGNQDIDDGAKAMAEQVTYTGHFSGPKKVGIWTPAFDLSTESFGDQNTAIFTMMLNSCNGAFGSIPKELDGCAGSNQYFWSRNNHFANIWTKGTCL